MKEALFYKKINNKIQCNLCPRNCIITKGKKGVCGVRENQNNKLISLVYAKPCSVAIDPIEKKPLYHFLPGSKALSIGTVGCNLKCSHCQNWQISQAKEILGNTLEPEQVVELAIQRNCKSIAYTYTEPTVFYEYVLDTAKIARKKGIKNIMVTNGYINPEPAKKLYKYIDAANVDLKAFNEDFYKNICKAELKPVLETIKLIKKMNVWLEITNLLIHELNDSPEQIKKMCEWITKNLGKDVPLHFSRFFPYYKMNNVDPTPKETLLKAKEIAKKAGINHIYLGNIMLVEQGNTFCSKCGKVIIKRNMYDVATNNLKKGKCDCGTKIPGVWT